MNSRGEFPGREIARYRNYESGKEKHEAGEKHLACNWEGKEIRREKEGRELNNTKDVWKNHKESYYVMFTLN